MQNEEFITQTSYDALNRPNTITQPDNTVVSHIYNKGGLLEQVLHGTVTYTGKVSIRNGGTVTQSTSLPGTKPEDEQNRRVDIKWIIK